jgi:hypothetical protein
MYYHDWGPQNKHYVLHDAQIHDWFHITQCDRFCNFVSSPDYQCQKEPTRSEYNLWKDIGVFPMG